MGEGFAFGAEDVEMEDIEVWGPESFEVGFAGEIDGGAALGISAFSATREGGVEFVEAK